MADSGTKLLRRLALRTAAATLAAGLAAAAFSLQLPNSYRARTLMLLAQMQFEQKDMVPGMLSAVNTPARRVNYVQVEQLEALAMPDYRLLLTSEDMVVRLRDRLRARYREAGINPGNLTHEKVLRGLDVRTKLLMQTQDKIEYQQVVELYLTAADPAIAADVANEWAGMAVEMAVRMRTLAREGAVEYVQEQLDRVHRKLDEALAGIAEIDRLHNPAALELRVAELEAAKTQALVRQTELGAGIARAEAEVAALNAAVASGEVALGREAGLRAAALAGQRAELDAVRAQIAELEPLIAETRAAFTEARRARAPLDVQVAALEKQADEFQVTLEATALAAGDNQPEFKIASRAVAPEEKVGPHRTLIVLVALFLAAVGTPIHFFAMYALRRYARGLESGDAAA